jgi:hypothetical protein
MEIKIKITYHYMGCIHRCYEILKERQEIIVTNPGEWDCVPGGSQLERC